MVSICTGWEFSGEWTQGFMRGEGAYPIVDLPHNVKEVSLHYASPSDYEGIYGYRRVIEADADMLGKRVFLQLDGAAHIAQVFLNGELLSEHRCGYTSFRTELSGHLKEGRNVLAVRLDSTENKEVPPFGFVIDYLTYSGLYREAWLDIKEQSFIEDVFVSTPDLKTVRAAVKVQGGTEDCRVRVLDGEKEIASVKKSLFTEEVKKERYVPELKILNEGLTTSGRVQFVCRGGMFIDDLKDYKGSLKVLNNVLTYGYLHESVRVKGGAYGCFGGFSRNGYGFFISYRDPNLKGTVDVFEKVPEAVENLELNEKQLEGFVISTTGDLDKPMTPSLKGLTDLTAYMQGLTDEMLQKERDEILNTSLEDLRGLSKYMKAILDNNIICVVGNIDAINREKNLFGTIRNLV